MISDAKIAEVRERADIAEVIGDYISLRKAGSNLKGVCPFHADSDPSFNVNQARQFYHCFGCGASGDIFSFMQRIEGIDFIESVRRLARRYGIDLPERPMSAEARTRAERAREASRRRRFVLDAAAEFFEEELQRPTGAAARDLLKDRGITDETATRFRLGYAPDAWSSCIDQLRDKGISPRELEEVGLAIPRKSGSGFYDRFRHRLIFTYLDPSGQPIAFSGRALADDGDGKTAKYINSPETPEYIKGKVLYGLHQARVALSKASEAVLVEGNFDVVSMSQAGVENVVAPLGTALTGDQASLLRGRVERVIVMFDGDPAGRAAASRAFPVLAQVGLASYTVSLPSGEDPDSLARKEGREGIGELLGRRVGLLDQIIDDTASSCDGSAQDIARKIEGMKPFIGALHKAVEADLYRGKIASAFGVDHRTVFRSLRGGAQVPTKEEKSTGSDSPPGQVAERELIGLLLDYPDIWENAIAAGMTAMITTPALKKVAEAIGLRYKRKESSIAELVAEDGSSQVGRWLAERAMVRIYDERDKAELALGEIRARLNRGEIDKEIAVLENQIKLANSEGDDLRVLELSRKKANLQKKGASKETRLFDEGAAKA